MLGSGTKVTLRYYVCVITRHVKDFVAENFYKFSNRKTIIYHRIKNQKISNTIGYIIVDF